MSLASVSPSDAVDGDTTTSSGGDDGAESVSPETSGGTSPADVLMHTRPDLAASEVSRRHGVSSAGAHLLIMVRKMLAAVVPSADDDSGMPAIGNGVIAAYHYLTGDRDDTDDDQEDGGDGATSFQGSGSGADLEELQEQPGYSDPASRGAPA